MLMERVEICMRYFVNGVPQVEKYKTNLSIRSFFTYCCNAKHPRYMYWNILNESIKQFKMSCKKTFAITLCVPQPIIL